jgi:hypothetical protein
LCAHDLETFETGTPGSGKRLSWRVPHLTPDCLAPGRPNIAARKKDVETPIERLDLCPSCAG